MNRRLRWILVPVIVALVVLGVIVLVLRMPKMGTGSRQAARQWRDRLWSCHGPDEIRRCFNCELFRIDPNGATVFVPDQDGVEEGAPDAWLYTFGDGTWLAIVYADSHSDPRAGGTIVSRDSHGEVKVLFGHVCGSPLTSGSTLEEVYRSFDSHWAEVVLED